MNIKSYGSWLGRYYYNKSVNLSPVLSNFDSPRRVHTAYRMLKHWDEKFNRLHRLHQRSIIYRSECFRRLFGIAPSFRLRSRRKNTRTGAIVHAFKVDNSRLFVIISEKNTYFRVGGEMSPVIIEKTLLGLFWVLAQEIGRQIKRSRLR